MRFIKYLSPLLLGLAINTSAQVFEASGVGDTPEAARKDAINNAIRFGAGEFVLSKEELNNEDFSQKIISHSNAYIKQIEVKSQVKLPNGSYETQVAVDLENQALLKSLKEMKVAVVENAVDNEALLQALNHFEKNDTAKNKEENLKELIYELMVKPIEENKEIYRVEVLGKLKPLKPQPNSDKFPFELEYQIMPMYIDNYKRVLKEVGVEKNLPEVISMEIPFFDLAKGNKGNLREEKVYVAKNIWHILRDVRQYYSLNDIYIGFVDKNGIAFKEMDIPLSDYIFNISYYNKPIKIFLGSYKEKIRVLLTKDEILTLKDIQISLYRKREISEETRKNFSK